MRVVLASGSAARARLLADAGVPFEARRPGVDEDAAKASLLAGGLGPREVADALAELKAVKVSAAEPDALMIGADQTLDLEGALLSKPVDREAARAQLVSL
ncbi:MAG: Maf family protein, partial [Caulobacteraceae bacterium]|nr:Maf family protein [Caulobacter sp.]